MYVISKFYGIIIYMFLNNYDPPYFRAQYNEFEAHIIIENGSIMDGDLPISKMKLVVAWAEIHKKELLEMWKSKKCHTIEPLK